MPGARTDQGGAEAPAPRSPPQSGAEGAPPRPVFVTLTGKGDAFGRSVIKRTLSESVIVCQALEASELPGLGDRAWAPIQVGSRLCQSPSWIPGRGAPPPSHTPRAPVISHPGGCLRNPGFPCRPPREVAARSLHGMLGTGTVLRLLGAPAAVPSSAAHQVREEPRLWGGGRPRPPALRCEQQAEGQGGKASPGMAEQFRRGAQTLVTLQGLIQGGAAHSPVHCTPSRAHGHRGGGPGPSSAKSGPLLVTGGRKKLSPHVLWAGRMGMRRVSQRNHPV